MAFAVPPVGHGPLDFFGGDKFEGKELKGFLKVHRVHGQEKDRGALTQGASEIP